MKIAASFLLAILIGSSGIVQADDDGGEDIYPEVFIDDCSTSDVGEYMCECLARSFFSQTFEDTPEAYRIFIETAESKKNILGENKFKNSALKALSQCQAKRSAITRGKENGIQTSERNQLQRYDARTDEAFQLDR